MADTTRLNNAINEMIKAARELLDAAEADNAAASAAVNPLHVNMPPETRAARANELAADPGVAPDAKATSAASKADADKK